MCMCMRACVGFFMYVCVCDYFLGHLVWGCDLLLIINKWIHWINSVTWTYNNYNMDLSKFMKVINSLVQAKDTWRGSLTPNRLCPFKKVLSEHSEVLPFLHEWWDWLHCQQENVGVERLTGVTGELQSLRLTIQRRPTPGRGFRVIFSN